MPHRNTIALWQADSSTSPEILSVWLSSRLFMPMQIRGVSFQHTVKTTCPDHVMQEGSEMPLCPGDHRIGTPLHRKLLCIVPLVWLYVWLSLILLSDFIVGRWELDLGQMFSNGQLILLERKETHAAITLDTLEHEENTHPINSVLNRMSMFNRTVIDDWYGQMSRSLLFPSHDLISGIWHALFLWSYHWTPSIALIALGTKSLPSSVLAIQFKFALQNVLPFQCRNKLRLARVPVATNVTAVSPRLMSSPYIQLPQPGELINMLIKQSTKQQMQQRSLLLIK